MLDLDADYFAESPKKKKSDTASGEHKYQEVIEQKDEEIHEIPERKTYYLMYPDSSPVNPRSGKYLVVLNGKERSLDIIDGIVKTGVSKIKEILVSQGFSFMYEIEE